MSEDKAVEEALEFLEKNENVIGSRCTDATIPELLANCHAKGFMSLQEKNGCKNNFANLTETEKWRRILTILQTHQEITMEGVWDIFSGDSSKHILRYLKNAYTPMEIPNTANQNQATARGSSQVVTSKGPDVVPVYKLNSDPKGRVLIINNDFRNDPDMKRKGSEVDVKNLTKFFGKHGFGVETHFNKTKKDICDPDYGLISDFIHRINEDPVDSVFVIIMSHGGQGGQIEMIGGTEINLYTDVVQKFSNNHKGLLGKPKIFITQACRGGDLDGIECEPQLMTDSRAFNHAKPISPKLSDVLLVFPSLEGYAAFRDTNLGSDLICNLLAAFEEYPDLTLDGQLKMANSKIKLRGKYLNCMEWRNLGFGDFYFNPSTN